MPWKETCAMSERKEFIRRAIQEEVNFSQLCREFEISRKTGYKWLKRYREEGIAGLVERSHRPKHIPKQTPRKIERAVIEVRKNHPDWGGRKIHTRLKMLGQESVPSPSTITAILGRNGLLDPEESIKHTAYQRFEMDYPNQLFQMDFKGPFEMKDGVCHPLTILDDHSRYLLGLKACQNEQRDTVKRHLIDVFREFGIPDAFLVDNGPPWGCLEGKRYHTKLSAWLFRLDIKVIHSRPYHPQTLGKDERLHRTLNTEVIKHNLFEDLLDCQKHFEKWQYVYNYERPHEALEMNVPASRYAPSKRMFPECLPSIEYLSNDVIRKVQIGGKIAYRGQIFHVGKAFTGYPVAIRPTLPDGDFDVFFCKQNIRTISFRM